MTEIKENLSEKDFIKSLKNKIKDLEQEKNDLDNLLEMTAEHSDHVVEEAILQKRHVEYYAEIERHKAISQMVAGIAHEINTPIGIANQGASLIIEALTPDIVKSIANEKDETTELLNDIIDASKLIEANIRRADHLIRSFKNLSVRQSNSESLESIPLCHVIDETLALYPTQEKHIKLDICFNNLTDENSLWLGYPGYLSQILLNLINNVQAHAYPKNQKGKVEITLEKNLGKYIISIQDFGCGIPEDLISQVFTAFFTTKRGKGGTGLGMAIVHNLVSDALQGSIELHSKENFGTTVTLSLPEKTDPHKTAHDTLGEL